MTALLGMAFSIIVLVATHVQAANSLERITLMLSGDGCPAARETVLARLHRTAGVHAVDGSLPGHLLIDVESDRISAADLARMVTEFTAGTQPCRAAVMQSCITAPVSPAR